MRNHRASRPGRRLALSRLSLTGQFLALQLGLIVIVLGVIAAVSVARADAEFRRTESRRLLSVAETVASQDAVRVGLGDPGRQGILQPTAEAARSVSGASSVEITGTDRRVLTSAHPPAIGRELPLGDSRVFEGRSWTGVVTDGGRTSVVAHVPVFSAEGRLLGAVGVGREHPGLGDRIAAATPHLLLYLGLAGVLGTIGSFLLARRIKKQTLGLEPEEITSLVEHREAMLHGIKEGVVGLDRHHRITLANDTARQLLRLPADAAGRTLEDLAVEPRLYDVLTGRATGRDQLVIAGERMLTLNRMPLITRDRSIGSVTTMRDLTELAALQHQLETTRSATNTLRAQAHEFSNQLHVIAGLIELGEYPEVSRYVRGISGTRTRRTSEVISKVADPSLAALLIAKASLAAEQGAVLRLTGDSALGPLPETLAADLVTVTGNLVDNALDAVRGAGPGGRVEVRLADDSTAVRLEVTDSGPGVAPELAEEVFRHGFTTKAADDVSRGLGLAITRMICTRRGGHVTVEGPRFRAEIPRTRAEHAEEVTTP
ncbi:ATP-binding protein [Streptomyces calidiresistens]|uniref:histidine kinase n=1 Tax=Streptomyces calidiresistens TaxID=1485586 RepID=A0A7W3XUQ9_9ACTN|nr:sensor histidine kinase [Streptomyces calidiresistens]MBB0227949.1 PAS domain-containing protein [Streptomyces calidiresistens]